MPITSSDILHKLSTTAGSAGDTTAGTPAGSLGKYVSTSQLSSTQLHNLFDTVTGDESEAGLIVYRCVFVHNTHATLTLINPVLWITSADTGGVDYALSVDTTPASDADAAAAQAKQIADETTAPAGQAFTAPTSKATGLPLGNLAPDEVRAFWVRLTVPPGTPAVNDDGVTWRVEGDTAA